MLPNYSEILKLSHLQLSLHLNIDCLHLIQLLTQGHYGGLLLEDILLQQTEGCLVGEGRGGEIWEVEEGCKGNCPSLQPMCYIHSNSPSSSFLPPGHCKITSLSLHCSVA